MKMVKIEDNKNNIVKKHNGLIQKARYTLNETEIKLVSTLISMIKKDDEDFQLYAIDIKEFQELTDTKTNDRYYFINIAKSLMSKPFHIENKVFNWVTYAEHTPGTSVIRFEIHRNLKPYLLDLQKNFTQYNIRNILLLKSGYVIRFYEYCIAEWTQYKKYNSEFTFELEIDRLRELFEIPESFKYNDIKRHIIDKAQKQFKEKTDIQFTYKEQKIGKRVDRLLITVKENSKGSNDFLASEKAFISHMRKHYVNADIYTARDKNTSKTLLLSVDQKGKLYNKLDMKAIESKRSAELWSALYLLAKHDKLFCLKQGTLF